MAEAPRAEFELPEGSVKNATSQPQSTAAAKDESPITASHRQGELIFMMVRGHTARQNLAAEQALLRCFCLPPGETLGNHSCATPNLSELGE